MSLVYLLPTARQYRRWSLPSRYSLIGLILGIVSLALGIVTVMPKRPTQRQQLELAAEELRLSYLCLETHVTAAAVAPCTFSLENTRGYIQSFGDWEISRLTFNDVGLLESTAEQLNDCVPGVVEINSVDDIPECGQLTNFDVYYLTRFSHWLLMPVQNDLMGTGYDVTAADIDNDFQVAFPKHMIVSKAGLAAKARPMPFVDRLD